MSSKIYDLKKYKLPKKYFNAFLTGLAKVRYQVLRRDPADNELSLEVLFENLFATQGVSAQDFQEVVNILYTLFDVFTRHNYSLKEFKEFLEQSVLLDDDQKEVIVKLWENEGNTIVNATTKKFYAENAGLKEIEWSANLTIATKNEQTTRFPFASVRLIPESVNGKDITFDVTKEDAQSIVDKLDKLNSLIDSLSK